MTIIQDLFVNQGATYAAKIHVTTEKNNVFTPFNLTGGTIFAHIKTYPESPTIIDEFTITVLSAAEGWIIIDLTDEQTSKLLPRRYVYDIIFKNSFGQNYRIVEGMMIVSAGISTG